MRMQIRPVLSPNRMLPDLRRFLQPGFSYLRAVRMERRNSHSCEGTSLNEYSFKFILALFGTSRESRRLAGTGIFQKEVIMRNLLIAAVATAALAFAGTAGAQTGTTNNNMNIGANANMNNMNMGGPAPAATSAQQPQKLKATKSRKHAAVHHRAKHKMARKAATHRLAKKSSSHRLAKKSSGHRIAKRSTSRHLGVAASKVQQPKQQQAKKRMPLRETTGTGSAGSMQNTSPNTNTQK
jgi:hypothetical protein